jgi:type I restriction enzyme S subunit
MPKIDELIADLCPEGVPRSTIGELCKVETGKRDANEGSDDGQYYFFTTAEKTGRIDTYRWDCDALLIAGNANIGNVKQYNGKFDAYQRTYVLTSFRQDVDVRYLYFALSDTLNFYLDANKNVAAMTYIVLKTLVNFEVSVPHLAVQREIVSILDKFTQLEAELEAELEARRSQYEHTRDQLLDFSGDLSSHPLRELIAEFCPEGVPLALLGDGVNNRDNERRPVTRELRQSGIYPYYGANGVQDYVQDFIFDGEFLLVGEDGSVIEASGAPVLNWAEGKIWVNNHAHVLQERTGGPILRFLYFYLSTINVSAFVTGGSQKKINQGNLNNIPIPLPPLEVQREIVSILDKLDALVNDLTFGLPAEISARRKQYEHYRNKLLAFKELETA